MLKKFEGFVGATNQSASPNVDASRTVNLYVEAAGEGPTAPKAATVFYNTPGLLLLATLPTSPVRGMWANDTRCFVVAGSKLYEIASNGSIIGLGGAGDHTARGDVGNDGLPVQFYPNGTQLIVISDGFVWIDDGSGPVKAQYTNGVGSVDTSGTGVAWVAGDYFTDDGTITGNLDPNLPGNPIIINSVTYTVSSVTDASNLVLTSTAGTQTGVDYTSTYPVTARTGAFLDGYFIAAKPNSKQINLSAINNGKSWDPIDFAVKEGYPDNIAAIFADHEELWLAGTDTTEVWQNTGDADFPLKRISGAFIHHGLGATFSPVRLKEGVAFLSTDPERGGVRAYACTGFAPTRVSTHAVETDWDSYSTTSDAVSYTYIENGHEHWIINFPTARKAWCFDVTAGDWTERAWWNTSATSLTFTAVAVSRGKAVYSYSSFTGLAPATGMPLTVTGFTTSGNNVTGAVITAASGGASGTVTVKATTQANQTHAGAGTLAGFDRQRQMFHVSVFGAHLVGDWENGNIYKQSTAYLDDAGTAIHFQRTAPHISEGATWIFYPRFQLELQVGTSTTAPTISLSWSNDGGTTFNTPRSTTPSLKNGKGRFLWKRLGRSRDRAFRIDGVVADRRLAIVQALLEAAAGDS